MSSKFSVKTCRTGQSHPLYDAKIKSKNMVQYILRLDDICETMSGEKFQRIIKMCTKYQIKPLLGVVPCNVDPNLMIQAPDEDFWLNLRQLFQEDKIHIALHGYSHSLVTADTNSPVPVSNLHNVSEFSGKSIEQQSQMIEKGLRKLKNNGLDTRIFIAPAHSFDTNTLKALIQNGITEVSDGLGLYPFKFAGLTFYPQQFGKPTWFPFGYITICLHPNSMDDASMIALDKFLNHNRRRFLSEISFSRYSFVKNAVNLAFLKLYLLARYIKT